MRAAELFSGTPSLMSAKMAIVHAAKERGVTVVMDVKCAFLYGVCRRRFQGQLHKAMCGTRAADLAKEVGRSWKPWAS